MKWNRRFGIKSVKSVHLRKVFAGICLACLLVYANIFGLSSTNSESSAPEKSIDIDDGDLPTDLSRSFPAGHVLFRGSFRHAKLEYRLEPVRGCHYTPLLTKLARWFKATKAPPERPITIFITSIPHEFEERLVIRETWARNASSFVQVVFSLGITSDSLIQSWLVKEARLYGDILQFNVMEEYKNLAWKTFFMLNWAAQNCPKNGLVMKTDTDTLVVLEGVYLLEQQTRNATNTIWGACPNAKSTWTGGGQPIRDPKSKWYAAENVYPGKNYPNFCSGTGYILTGDAPAKLVAAAKTRGTYFHLEDVMFTGIAAQTANVTRQYHVGFSSGGGINCRRETITQHLWHSQKRKMESEWLKRQAECSSHGKTVSKILPPQKSEHGHTHVRKHQLSTHKLATQIKERKEIETMKPGPISTIPAKIAASPTAQPLMTQARATSKLPTSLKKHQSKDISSQPPIQSTHSPQRYDLAHSTKQAHSTSKNNTKSTILDSLPPLPSIVFENKA